MRNGNVQFHKLRRAPGLCLPRVPVSDRADCQHDPARHADPARFVVLRHVSLLHDAPWRQRQRASAPARCHLQERLPDRNADQEADRERARTSTHCCPAMSKLTKLTSAVGQRASAPAITRSSKTCVVALVERKVAWSPASFRTQDHQPSPDRSRERRARLDCLDRRTAVLRLTDEGRLPARSREPQTGRICSARERGIIIR